MMELKHVGKVVSTGRKVIVAYRTLPGDSDYCLVVPTENLTDPQHDALIRLVESSAGQSAYEFAEVMARSTFPDGSIMLANLHVNRKLIKLKTDQVLMTPTFTDSIRLDELNSLIASQRGVSINDLAIAPERPDPNVQIQEVAQVNTVPEVQEEQIAESVLTSTEPLSDDQIAKKYRSDADRLSKEAAKLRRMADELVPPVKRKRKS